MTVLSQGGGGVSWLLWKVLSSKSIWWMSFSGCHAEGLLEVSCFVPGQARMCLFQTKKGAKFVNYRNQRELKAGVVYYNCAVMVVRLH